MEKNIKHFFEVEIFGDLTKFNDVATKGRCRIFYKYANRNGSFITDEFAEKLLSSIAYAPVKGIFSEEEEDFQTHSKRSSNGKAFGVVPENYNLTWEPHLDKDGVERIYACVDVILWTALYGEAATIIGHPQSMELYPPSIQGDWQLVDGKNLFVYTDGCFLGLQILGKDIEPCFEGAAFYALQKDLQSMMDELKKFTTGGENKNMHNFSLSFEGISEKIMGALNTVEDKWEFWVVETFDTYAIYRDYAQDKYFSIGYTLNEAEEVTLVGEPEEVFSMFLTSQEKLALETLKTLNGNTFDKIDENFTAIQTQNSEFDTKINDLISDNKKTLEDKEAEFALALEAVNTSNAELLEFKKAQEKTEKESLLKKFELKLSADVLEKFSDVDNFSYQELKLGLADALVDSTPSLFTVGGEPNDLLFTPAATKGKTGAIALVEKFKSQNKN